MTPYKSLSVAVTLPLLLLFPLISAQQGFCSWTGPAPPSAPPGLDRVIAVRIYGVQSGRSFQRTLTRKEIPALAHLTVEGYVSGVVVFCRSGMSIRLDGQPFHPLRKNRDGSFITGAPGGPTRHIQPVDIRDNAYFQTSGPDNEPPREGTAVRNAYSYFSKVAGGAVRSEQQFDLEFEDDHGCVRLGVRQVGYRSARLACPDYRIPFRYQGTRLDHLEEEIPDIDQRMAAVARGIESVENTLGQDLVSEAVILDYTDIKNAITREDSDKIWFYIETFREEPLPELETIAAHEALHKYVDRRRLIHSGLVREWFSDLKSFGPLSYERLLMVTQGVSLHREETRNDADDLFFRFINEKHFLEDRKGGHAGDNLDEFCTSFLHSLLYVQRLESNLNRPIRRRDGSLRLLTADQKQEMLNNYIHTIEIFREVLSLGGDAAGESDAPRDGALLLDGYGHARQIRSAGITATAAVGRNL
jgi:hypothetical protein